MCLGGGSSKVDTSAQDAMLADSKRARADEIARQGRIKQGTAGINANFAGFDDTFYKGFTDTLMSYYQPQLDQQFGDAQDRMTYGLADAGMLRSSVAGKESARLTSSYQDNLAQILADSTGQTDALRTNIGNERNSLVSMLNATGDADRASNEALSRSQQIFQAQPKTSLLPDVFAGAANAYGGYRQTQNNQQAVDAYFGRGRSTSSGRVVN
jgi:hypothetical protein